MKKIDFLLVLLTGYSFSCGTTEPVVAPIPTPSLSVSAPAKTQTLTSTRMPVTLTTPTPMFVEGTLTLKVNVRSGPGINFDSLGQLESGEKVRITARDLQGAWYLILFSSAPQGQGWVASQYVSIGAGTEVPLDATPTRAGPTGRTLQRINVRSGPGTSYSSLGYLEPGLVVTLTGKNVASSWFQIDYPAGAGGHGWVTSQYIKPEFTGDLPVMDEFGNIVTPGPVWSPPGPVIPPAPTVGPAFQDLDSSTNPVIDITFSSIGTHQFTYSSQVSAPEGDSIDWLEFSPYATVGTTARLSLSLACTGNGSLSVQLWQSGTLLSGWGALACGENGKMIHLTAGQDYRLSLSPNPGDGLRLIAYTLTVKNEP